MISFVTVQAIREQPLVPLGIFKAPNLAAANFVMALLGAAWIPMWFFLNLYLQQVLSFGAFESGAALLPMTLTIMVLMVGATSRIVGRFGFKSPLVVGLVVMAGGIGVLTAIRSDGQFGVDVLPASIMAAVGMSFAYIPAMLAALAGARPEEGGLASGLVNTSYQFGSAIGLAVTTAIATAAGADEPGNLSALTNGFQAAFAAAALVAVAGAAVAVGLLRKPQYAATSTEADDEVVLVA
jgi:MFS family permease